MKKEGNCMEKNLQEFYEELVKSDSLINEYKEAQKNGTVVEFAKAHGCNTTEEEIKAFIEEKTANGKEMSDEELDAVAGGSSKGLEQGEEYYKVKCELCGTEIDYKASKWEEGAIHEIWPDGCHGKLHLVDGVKHKYNLYAKIIDK